MICQIRPLAPRLSARLQGCSHALRPCRVMAPFPAATAAVVHPLGQFCLLRLLDAPPRQSVTHLLLLRPFAFRQVYATPPSVVAALVAPERCLFSLFPAWFPGGATLSRSYLRRLPTTRYYVRSDSFAPPDSRLLRPRPFGVQVEVRSSPHAVRQLSFGLPPAAIFLIPGSLQPESEREAKTSPDQACYFLPAPSRTTLGVSRASTLSSLAPAGGFSIPSSLAFHRAPYIRVRSPTAQTFVSNPPGPRLTATPCYFDYPAQERSTGTGLSPASSTPCRACWGPALAGAHVTQKSHAGQYPHIA